ASRLARYIRLLLSLLVLAGITVLAANNLFFRACIAAEFYPWVFATVILIHLRLLFRWWDLIAIAVVGVFLAFVDLWIPHYGLYVVAWVSFFGLGSVATMALRSIWTDDDERKSVLLAFVPSLLLLGSNFAAGYFHIWTEKAHPKVLDLYLASF